MTRIRSSVSRLPSPCPGEDAAFDDVNARPLNVRDAVEICGPRAGIMSAALRGRRRRRVLAEALLRACLRGRALPVLSPPPG
jgi:hypothetical protein